MHKSRRGPKLHRRSERDKSGTFRVPVLAGEAVGIAEGDGVFTQAIIIHEIEKLLLVYIPLNGYRVQRVLEVRLP